MNTATRLRLTAALLVLAGTLPTGCNFPGRGGECVVDEDCPWQDDTCYENFCYSRRELADMDIIVTPEVE